MYVKFGKQVDFLKLIWVQKQRFIQIICEFVITLMHMGTQEKLFSWPREGQELQQNLGHTEAESEIVKSFRILGGSRNVGLRRGWIMTLVFHCFHDIPSSGLVLLQLMDFFNLHPSYFLDFLVSDPHNFNLFMMHHGPSGLFLSHDLLSYAAKYFTHLVFLSWNSREKKSGWPRFCFMTIFGNQYWIGDLCSKI